MIAIRIALSGKMRSGKDTIAARLVDEHGFVRVAFADKLKDIAKDLFRVRETRSNRPLLQALGLQMARIDKGVWTRHVLDKIPATGNVVVSDLRFPEEYHALKGFGFVMVRVSIDPEEQWRRIARVDPDMPRELLNDPSETALDIGWKWDYVMDGKTDTLRLFRCVDEMLRDIKRRRR